MPETNPILQSLYTGGVSPCPGGNYLTLRPNNAILGLKLPLVADGLVTER